MKRRRSVGDDRVRSNAACRRRVVYVMHRRRTHWLCNTIRYTQQTDAEENAASAPVVAGRWCPAAAGPHHGGPFGRCGRGGGRAPGQVCPQNSPHVRRAPTNPAGLHGADQWRGARSVPPSVERRFGAVPFRSGCSGDDTGRRRRRRRREVAEVTAETGARPPAAARGPYIVDGVISFRL